jgi:hypothetical protein
MINNSMLNKEMMMKEWEEEGQEEWVDLEE